MTKDSVYTLPKYYSRQDLEESLQYYLELGADDFFKHDIDLIKYDLKHNTNKYYDYMMNEYSFYGSDDNND